MFLTCDSVETKVREWPRRLNISTWMSACLDDGPERETGCKKRRLNLLQLLMTRASDSPGSWDLCGAQSYLWQALTGFQTVFSVLRCKLRLQVIAHRLLLLPGLLPLLGFPGRRLGPLSCLRRKCRRVAKRPETPSSCEFSGHRRACSASALTALDSTYVCYVGSRTSRLPPLMEKYPRLWL